jgi:hypothetical protein
MSGDPFVTAGDERDRIAVLVAELHAGALRLWNLPPCEWCGFTYVHAHDCVDRMNDRRTPTGDWWKL